MVENNAQEEREPSYEERAAVALRNLGDFERHYFASLMKSGEHGKAGQVDGLYAMLSDPGRLISDLRRQGLENIEQGNGLEFQLSREIPKGARVFIESLSSLKTSDIIPYIKERLDVDIEERYSDKMLAELSQGSDEEKAYMNLLLSQTRNAVMAKMVPLAYKERAREENARYISRYPREQRQAREELRQAA